MWYRIQCNMPYYGDLDYQLSLIANLKVLSNNAIIDITLLKDYGIVEIDTDEDIISAISKLPLVGEIRPSVDREMISNRTYC